MSAKTEVLLSSLILRYFGDHDHVSQRSIRFRKNTKLQSRNKTIKSKEPSQIIYINASYPNSLVGNYTHDFTFRRKTFSV